MNTRLFSKQKNLFGSNCIVFIEPIFCLCFWRLPMHLLVFIIYIIAFVYSLNRLHNYLFKYVYKFDNRMSQELY